MKNSNPNKAFAQGKKAWAYTLKPSSQSKNALGRTSQNKPVKNNMAKLTYKKRKKLSKKSFAEPKKRAYPIEDKNHARNALARVSQYGTPAEKAKVRAAVHRKYPDIGKDHKESMKKLHRGAMGQRK